MKKSGKIIILNSILNELNSKNITAKFIIPFEKFHKRTKFTEDKIKPKRAGRFEVHLSHASVSDQSFYGINKIAMF